MDVLAEKTKHALADYPVHQLILAGGVAANKGLRERLECDLQSNPTTHLVKAPLKLCGDNAAMIGAFAYVAYQHGVFADATLNADPSLEFDWAADSVK